MFIVYIGKKKHSAWKSRKSAEHQIEVLIENGYQEGSMWIEHIPDHEILSYYDDGHYFV